jgi:penicillin-binding protein 1B
LCVIWIGNDDYTDLELSGGATAAPIWAEFMKRATKLPRYRDTKYFPQPPGLAAMKFDSNSGHVKTASCPQSVAGDEPTQSCEEAPKNRDLGAAGSDGGNLSGQDFPLASATVAEPWSNHVSTATSAAVTVPRN